MELADLLKAAGDPTRLRLLNLLRGGDLCVCELQALLGLPQPTISRHLGVLRHAALVTDRREGPRVIYSLAAKPAEPRRSFLSYVVSACERERGLSQEARRLRRSSPVRRRGVQP